MTSCILTIIKNEHLYLDEWIKYHLDIGVNHIFIFEDIDSDSHKEITDKYKDKVTLNSVSFLLLPREINHIYKIKQTKESNPQVIYAKKGLWYIKNNFNYDWCFFIDCDEFITLEDSTKTVNDIMSLYINYDALLLSWECYGADGLIKTPNYAQKGVVDTYTKPISEELYYFNFDKKTCYNLKKYTLKLRQYIHHPHMDYNFCNSVFQKDVKNRSYKNIYLRHYITKSWEEYTWKKINRGYFVGTQRTFSMFFKINPDMNYLKNKLISQIKETLVVMPYVNIKSQGEEIYLALQGWRKYCQFSYHFVVIGEFDEKLKNTFDWVEFISIPSISPKKGQYNPHLDIQHKLELIYEKYHDEYNGFIQVCDDFYAIKPFDIDDILTTHYHSLSFTGVENLPASCWKHDKWKTRQLLDKENLPHINYTGHLPWYYNFKYLKEIWDKFNMREESYVAEDVYFNYYHDVLEFKPVLDSDIRLGIWNQEIFKNDFQKALSNPKIKFVCNSVEGWSPELEQALTKLYQDN